METCQSGRMGFTANEVWGTTPPGVQIPPSPRLAPVLDRGLLRSRSHSGWQDRPMSSRSAYDAIIVGGGHNGLAAAAYMSKAGRTVLLLEKLGHPGGAAVSAQAFDGVDARLSRYSYLVSLLPQQVIDELGLRIQLARRRYSSYTPLPHSGGQALLIDNEDPAATAASFAAVGAPDGEFEA